MGHGHLQHAGAGWNGGHALRYFTDVLPETTYYHEAAELAYCGLLGCESELYGIDEGLASADVSNASKMHGTKGIRDTHPEYLVLGSTHVLIENARAVGWVL